MIQFKNVGDTQKFLVNLIDQWLSEPEIKGVKIVQKNLARLVASHKLVLDIFSGATNIEFSVPDAEQKYCFTYIITGSVDVIESEHKKKFIKLLELTDTFAVLPHTATSIFVVLSVDNIWIE